MKQENRMVSVIVPVYNGEKYIKRCLNSILEQSYKNIELIVVNDGSTDKTLEIISSIEDERMQVISQENKGVSSARNIGLKVSKGDYILLFDADDFMEKDILEVLVNDIKANDVQAVKSNLFLYYPEEDRKILYKEKIFDGKNKIIDKYELLDMVISGEVMGFSPNILFCRTEENIQYNEEIFYMEDVIFYIKILKNINKIYIENKPSFSYTQNQNSATKSQSKILKNIHSLKKYNKKAKEELKNSNFYTKERVQMIDTRNTILISDLLAQIDYKYIKRKEAIKIFKEIFEEEGNLKFLKNFNKNKLKIYKLILINLGLNKKYNLLYYYIKLRKRFSKIKKVLKRRK